MGPSRETTSGAAHFPEGLGATAQHWPRRIKGARPDSRDRGGLERERQGFGRRSEELNASKRAAKVTFGWLRSERVIAPGGASKAIVAPGRGHASDSLPTRMPC